MDNNYVVYKHTFPDGKVYIGCTKRNPFKRWDNGWGYYNNKLFMQAILLVGWNNIKHEIIFEGLNKRKAYEIENEMILKYRSNEKEYGYNISTGFGKTGTHYKHSKETLQKISNSRKGKRVKEEHPMAKPIYCVELDKIFLYGKLAEEETGVNRSHICQVCRGQRKTAGGYHWQYYKEAN